KWIFRYLKGKAHLGLWYPKDSPFNLVAYSYSDYAGASLDRKSTTGGYQFLGCRLISWQCKKQTVMATSSIEVEYVAAASCYAQVLWIQNQLLDYGLNVTAVSLKFLLFESIDCLPNEEIFTELSRMGYEKPSTKLTFYKAFFSPQWKFLIHTILQCMSAKKMLWNEFSSSMASAVICLSTGKGFSRVDTLLFEGMIVAQQVDESAVEVNVDDVPAVGVADEGVANVNADAVLTAADEPIISSLTPTTPPPPPSQDVPSTSQDAEISMDLIHNLLGTCTTLTRKVENLEQDKIAQALEIAKLKHMVKKLEKMNKLKVSKLRRLKRVGTAQRVDISDDTVMDDVSKQGRIIASMDADMDVTLNDGRQAVSQAQIYQIDLEHADKVLSMQDDEVEPAELQEVVKVVTTAKHITEVVTAASATITDAAPQLTTVAAPTLTTAPSAARKRKGVVIRDPKETATQSTIIHSEAKSKDKGKMILYKDQMEEEDSRAHKRTSESRAEKAAKKQKLDEEVAELKRHLQIVPNNEDGVYTEATPLARKVPIVDYEIYTENNKPYYKIIRADGSPQLFLSFLSLLRNFDREDLEKKRVKYPWNCSDLYGNNNNKKDSGQSSVWIHPPKSRSITLEESEIRCKVIITEATIRDALRLNDAESIDCLPNEEIFTKLSRIGLCCGPKVSAIKLNVTVTNDVVRLQDLIDRRKVIITKASVRQALRLDDAESVDCLPNEEIFAELARMGYEKPSTKGLSGMNSVLPWLQLLSAWQQDAAEPTSPTPATTPPPPQELIPSSSQVASTLPLSPHQSPITLSSSPPPQQPPSHDAAISMDLLN
nr:uncharacterized mitochondrial protein AtMg00810-like [Tanacetum cinerariifolium]